MFADGAPTTANQPASVPDHLTNMMRSRRFTLYAIGK
jgi:hypothetical protein